MVEEKCGRYRLSEAKSQSIFTSMAAKNVWMEMGWYQVIKGCWLDNDVRPGCLICKLEIMHERLTKPN